MIETGQVGLFGIIRRQRGVHDTQLAVGEGGVKLVAWVAGEIQVEGVRVRDRARCDHPFAQGLIDPLSTGDHPSVLEGVRTLDEHLPVVEGIARCDQDRGAVAAKEIPFVLIAVAEGEMPGAVFDLAFVPQKAAFYRIDRTQPAPDPFDVQAADMQIAVQFLAIAAVQFRHMKNIRSKRDLSKILPAYTGAEPAQHLVVVQRNIDRIPIPFEFHCTIALHRPEFAGDRFKISAEP